MKTFEQQWRARFERFAQRYEEDHLISGWSPIGLRQRLALFQELVGSQLLPDGAAIIDIGCGAGTYVRLLGRRGFHPIGLDYSLPSLARAIASDGEESGRYVAGDAYALPFPAATFDLVIAIGVLQTLTRPEQAFDEMARVVRPQGWIIIEALNRNAIVAVARKLREAINRVPPRVRSYDARKVRQWLTDRGLEVVRQAGIFLPPRQLPGLAWLFCGRVVSGLETASALGAFAHAYWFIARNGIATAEGFR